MAPPEDKTTNQDSGAQKIIVDRRNLLAKDQPTDSEGQDESSDIEAKESLAPLSDHKIKLERNEGGAIKATDEKKPFENPASPTPAEKPIETAKPPASQPVAKSDPDEAAKQETVKRLIDDKKYFVPTAHTKSHQTKRQFILTFLVVLAVGLIAIDLAIDAGMIETGISPPINLINN